MKQQGRRAFVRAWGLVASAGLAGACASSGPGYVVVREQPVQVHTVAVGRPPPVQLVRNGDFEEPALAPGTWNVFPGVPGWSLSFGAGLEVQHRAAGAAYSGGQLVELDGNDATGIYQDLETVPGQAYQLRYAFSARPGTASDQNDIDVLFDGQLVAHLRGDGEQYSDTRWVVRTHTVQATSPRTRLEFRYTGPSDSLGGYLDAVTVSPISL